MVTVLYREVGTHNQGQVVVLHRLTSLLTQRQRLAVTPGVQELNLLVTLELHPSLRGRSIRPRSRHRSLRPSACRIHEGELAGRDRNRVLPIPGGPHNQSCFWRGCRGTMMLLCNHKAISMLG